MFIEKQKSAAVVWILNLAFHQHMPTTSAYTQNTCIVDMQAHIVFVSPVCNRLVNCLLCHEKEQGEEGIVVGLHQMQQLQQAPSAATANPPVSSSSLAFAGATQSSSSSA